MKNKKIIFLIISGLLILGCAYDRVDNRLKFINQSNGSLYFHALPDTIIKESNVSYLSESRSELVSISDTTFVLFAFINEGGIAKKINAICKDSTLKIFVFSVDSVKKYDWNNILELKKYKRLDYRVSELDNIDWKIIYR